jgi:hypothetical protein
VIRLACERPADSDVPLARWSSAELAAEVVARGVCEQISGITVWRWLSQDAIKPWQYRSWIFPRDPEFTIKAGRILDLYAGRWEGELLHPGDYVVCCDEKEALDPSPLSHAHHAARQGDRQARTARRARIRKTRRPVLLRGLGRPPRQAVRSLRRQGGIVPFDKLIEQFMSVEPYSKAQRVFVIVDNGSAHRGQKSIKRLQGRYHNLILVHTPVHASWLNQAEIYFSIVQRKVLTPNGFPDLEALEHQLRAFGRRYEQIAQPFEWKFTRQDLDRLAQRLDLPAAQAA